jgi:hypothetical protein
VRIAARCAHVRAHPSAQHALDRLGQGGRVLRRDQHAAPVAEHARQALHRGADHRHTQAHGERGGLRPGVEAGRNDAYASARDPARRVVAPALEPHALVDAQARRAASQLRLHRSGTEHERGRRLHQPGECFEQQIGALLGMQPPGEHDSRRRQAAHRRCPRAGDRGRSLAHALGRKSRGEDLPAHRGAMGEEQVHTGERLAQRSGGGAAGPLERVVLTCHEGHAVRYGARRRPPGAEHVPVYDVLAVQRGSEPLGERAAARVLKRRPPAEQLDVDPVRAEQGEPFACRMAGEPPRLDVMGAEPQRKSEGAELRAARLEHRDHARHPHRSPP